ncbi:hypothetical protein BGZ63DRAFT_496357 [Mariannaea sp. PMI_226]|nr:hypothetical protein BGZ63DRAFT_496357 [Mariannaea sp. PMI_226]
MAEAFGIITGAVSLVSFIVDLHAGIHTLREIRRHAKEAQADLNFLELEVERLGRLLSQVDTTAPCVDDIVFQELIQQCRLSCSEVVQNLTKLDEKLKERLKKTTKQKLVPKVIAFRNWKDDLEDLKRNLQRARDDLLMAMIYRTSTQVNRLALDTPLLTATVSTVSRSEEKFGSSARTVEESLQISRPPRRNRPWNCETRHCSCSCHSMTRTGGRFWELQYTPLSVFRNACDNESCSVTKYSVGFRVALSQLGIRQSLALYFHVATGGGSISLRPALTMERIVPHTSPGFEIIWRAEYGLITLQEARNSLITLRNSDRTFKDHVNPSGKSYIEQLALRQWFGSEDVQIGLLRLFMVEFDMKRGTENTSFLLHCARWIEEGGHLAWLEYLVQFGYDATLIDSPTAQDWPEPQLDPVWRWVYSAPDPFFIDYIQLLCRDNQGFGMMTPLHEAVLSSDTEVVRTWAARSRKDERNFLGQTPLHIAVLQPHHLETLIQSGHTVDAVDKYGITPLMYAAAMDQEESIMKLLEAGAAPHITDTLFKHCFLQYAAARGHWHLMIPILEKVKLLAVQDYAKGLAKLVVILSHIRYPDWFGTRCFSLDQILDQCGSVNFTCGKFESQDNTLLHYVKTVAEVDALLKHGCSLINYENSTRRTPLLSALAKPICKSDLIERLMDAGANINHKDHFSHTPLYYAFDRLQDSRSPVEASESISKVLALVTRGADCMAKDDCRCSCSPGGCFPAAALGHSVDIAWGRARLSIWSLEFLSILLEEKGENVAKPNLLSFIRKAKHSELDMKHVCEHPNVNFDQLSRFRKMSDDDIDEILDEESEFIEILESEMSQCYEQTYEELLDVWGIQIKVSLDKACEEAELHNTYIKERRKTTQRASYTVDYERDEYIGGTVDMATLTQDPVKEVKSDLARYVAWLEYEYDSKRTNILHASKRDDWYSRRLPWVYRLTNVLEIPVREVADEALQLLSKDPLEEGLQPVNHKKKITHFLSSWAAFESTTAFGPEVVT